MLYEGLRKSAVLCLVMSTTVFSLSALVTGQSTQPVPERSGQKKNADPVAASESDQIRWRLMLDQLNEQARTLREEKDRPQIMAEVASAYSALNKDKSGDLFMSALEAALNLKSNPKDSNVAVRHVLSLAARSDAALSKRLTRRFMESRAQDVYSSSAAIEAAMGLIKTDPKLAAELAEASAPAGLSGDAAGAFIFQLAQQDLPAAEKVYRAYLANLSTNQSPPLGQLLWLAGYSLGHGESYGFAINNPNRISGFGGRQIPDFAPNPALAKTFLGLAHQSIQRTLQAAASEPPPKRDSLYGLALFATTYLSPEVAKFGQEMAGDWQVLHQQAASGTPVGLQQEITKQIQYILDNRVAAKKQTQSPEYYMNERIQADLERSETLPDGCERDRSYAQAALGIGHTKDYTRAFATAERIKDIPLRESVTEFLRYDLSSAAIKDGNLYDAQKYARRVEARDQRTLLYVKIAEVALREKDQVLANQLLSEMRQAAGGISDRSAQAAVLLAAAAVYAQFDPLIADETLKDAIKAINQSGSRNVESFSILRKVSLACPGDTYPRWYGNRDQVDRFSLIDTLTSLSKDNFDGYILMAEGIEDPVTRIRAQLAIVKAAIKN